MRLNLLYVALIGMLVSFSACESQIYDNHQEIDKEIGKEPQVFLSITKAQAAGLESLNTDNVDYEDRVHDLAMLVFDSSTGAKVCEFYEEGIPFSDKEKTFTVQMTTGLRDFYFIANMAMDELKDITTKSAMDVYMNTFRDLDTDLYLNAVRSKGFPMSRVYMNQAITEGGNIYSPKPFHPDGEERVKLVRVAAKLEVQIEGSEISSGVKNIYYKNAQRKFNLVSPATPVTPVYYEDKPLKKVGNTYIYYMPEALMTAPDWSASADHKPVNYFLIETLDGTFYEIPIITDNRTITDTDYLSFATGRQADKPDYNIYRNRHYFYIISKLQKIEIIYTIDPWQIKQSSAYMGYGYNVTVDENGKVTISNTVEACTPHAVKLKTITPFKFSDGTVEKEFDSLDTTASENYQLESVPAAGQSYIEVWYNGYLVKTFTK
ncbi:fimbrial protein [Dysgonomonas termitidis]|uniref:Fimbrial protein n=1 Tax=Dysgonomonas termitidis TaxID=1516126 RepID=A0ABV9KUB0_9BACT